MHLFLSKNMTTIITSTIEVLLRDHVVPSVQERHALPVVAFMQDSGPAHEIKTFLLGTLTEDRVKSAGCKFNSTPADF